MHEENRITPVILCGGSGTRLWPLSRKGKPKPFLPLIGEATLFQQAVMRTNDASLFGPPMIVAGADHCEIIEEQLAETQDYTLVVEPCGRNTAPAIALAASLLPPETIMLVCPSDHHIADEDAFRKAAIAAAELAREDWLVSFGIAPDRPETGYGYLLRGEALNAGYQIRQFVEKPDIETAQAYLETGQYSWNGGIFAFRAGALLSELKTHRSSMADAIAQSAEEGTREGSRFYPQSDRFATIDGESIDYAVMENTTRAAMVPVDMGWSDIGNWAALKDALNDQPNVSDCGGNVIRGTADVKDCSNVLAISDGPRVSAVGLEDVCIVVSGGEVLVTSREGAQQVGKLPGARNQ